MIHHTWYVIFDDRDQDIVITTQRKPYTMHQHMVYFLKGSRISDTIFPCARPRIYKYTNFQVRRGPMSSCPYNLSFSIVVHCLVLHNFHETKQENDLEHDQNKLCKGRNLPFLE